MAEAAAAAAPQKSDNARVQGAKDSPEPRRVDAERVPSLAVTTDPRWALAFLAKVYEKAKKLKVLNSLPSWIEPDSRSLRTVLNPSRNASFANRRAREMVVDAVVADLIKAKDLPSTTPTDLKSLNALFERETIVGTSLIEGIAQKWMSDRLATSRRKVLQIILDAGRLGALLSQAATLVVKRVETTQANIRSDALYRAMYPKNMRYWRDGTPEQRIAHVRYILAVRGCIEDLRIDAIVQRAQPVDLGAEARGLNRTPPAQRAVPETSAAPAQVQKSGLAEAFRLLQTMAWHPKAVPLINALKNDQGAGFKLLAEVVNGSVKSIDDLSGKLNADRSLVWRFPAALRGAIEALNIIEKDPVTQYALVWASAVKPALDTALDVVGNVVTLLELFGGPLAPIAAVADAIVQAVAAAVNVLRQLEQDQAESATEFEEEAERLSTGGKYADVVVQGASALVAATSVPGAVGKVLRAVRKEKALAPKPAVGAKGTDPGTSMSEGARRGTAQPGIQRPASGQTPKQNPISKGTGTSEPTVWAAQRRNTRPTEGGRPGYERMDVSDESRLVEEQGMRFEEKPPASRAPPSGGASGAAGEGREWLASGLAQEPRTYRRVIDPNMQQKLRRDLIAEVQANYRRRRAGLADQVDETLRNYVNRFDKVTHTPIEEIRDVPFHVWVPDQAGALERRFDRVIRMPDRKILMRETKAYATSALDYEKKMTKRQLQIDAEVMRQYPYAAIEYRLDGNVLDTTMRKLEAMENQFAGQFRINRAAQFREVTVEELRKVTPPRT